MYGDKDLIFDGGFADNYIAKDSSDEGFNLTMPILVTKRIRGEDGDVIRSQMYVNGYIQSTRLDIAKFVIRVYGGGRR
jgi:hypothetical protein